MGNEDDLSSTALSTRAKSGYPLIIPWTTEPLPLGTSFESTLAHTLEPFLKSSAFDTNALHQVQFLYTGDGGTGNYASTSTMSSRSSDTHMSFSLGVTVGCSFLNASVTGSYEKDVLENDDVSNYFLQ
jgi:hypothetical protein